MGTALVTGGSGFVGSHLIPALVGNGWQVRTCGRRERPASLPPDVDYQRVDIAGDDDLDGLFDGVTHLFHLAGASSSRSSEDEMRKVNVVGTERVLDAARRADDLERVLHMSTTAVYGEEEQLPVPVPEDVEPKPSRGYGKAKWQAEQVVWRQVDDGLPAVVVRPVTVYGPGNTKLLASTILDVAVERFMGLDTLEVPEKPVEQRMLHVDDLVAACIHLAGHPDAVGKAYNVASGLYPSSHELAGILAEHFGLRVEPSADPDCGPSFDARSEAREQMLAKGMQDDILLTEERLRLMRKSNPNNRLSLDALLGTGFELQHTDLRDSVVGTVEWYEQHRWVL